MSHVPSYAAIVLYHRLGESVVATLDAVTNQSVVPTETLLVDNASEDGVAGPAARAAGAALLELGHNGGYAAGMNAGARHLQHDHVDYLLFITHEVRLPRTAVATMLDLAVRTGAPAVAPTLVEADGTVFSRGGVMTWPGAARHRRAASAGRIDWLDGAALLVRRDVYESLGGFDEDYFLYWEDVDFTHRARSLGDLAVCDVPVVQSQSGMPVYLNARGRVLFWRKQRRYLRAAIAPVMIAIHLVYAQAYSVWARQNRPAFELAAVARGTADGWSGRLHMGR